jgi:O-6-methylguanine DNA methyltransferase
MIIKDEGGSMISNNMIKWDHPFILIPIDVFIKPITLILNCNTLYMVLFADTKKVSTYFESPGFNYEISDPSSYPAGVQILEYFEGKRTVFDIPIDIRGTDFQISVWKKLIDIPFGKTLSYAQIADKIDNPRAYRAVGSSCGANPLPIVIPCHRVLASDGSLGGYSGGLEIKKALLQHEKQILEKGTI